MSARESGLGSSGLVVERTPSGGRESGLFMASSLACAIAKPAPDPSTAAGDRESRDRGFGLGKASIQRRRFPRIRRNGLGRSSCGVRMIRTRSCSRIGHDCRSRRAALHPHSADRKIERVTGSRFNRIVDWRGVVQELSAKAESGLDGKRVSEASRRRPSRRGVAGELGSRSRKRARGESHSSMEGALGQACRCS